MEINIDLSPYRTRIWNYLYGLDVNNQDILKNVFVGSDDEDDRYKLMMHLLREMDMRLPPFSTLYLNLNPKVKCSDAFFDKEYTYGSQDFTVPYYLDIEYQYPMMDHFERCFNAILDFHPEMVYTLGVIYDKCEAEGFPVSIIDFLILLKEYTQAHPYDDEFTGSLIKSIDDAIMLFRNDTVLEQIFSRASKLPEWLKLWRSNKKIWIDLSSCRGRVQKILIAGIFHVLLKTTNFCCSPEDYWHLRGIVVLNDAKKVFERVPWEQYKANYNRNRDYWRYLREQNFFLTKEEILEAYGDINYLFNSQLEHFYRSVVSDDFRYRNISLFAGVHHTEAVYEFIKQNSQLRFLQCPDKTHYVVEKVGFYGQYKEFFGNK